MPTTLTLTRRGSFQIFVAKNDQHQCGLRGTRKLYYRVEVTCPDTELDEQGFMVDQLEVNRAIKLRYLKVDKFLSCELLAVDIARMVSKMVKNPLRVVAMCGMSEKAYMTAELNFTRTKRKKS